jgi:hypothetical protein
MRKPKTATILVPQCAPGLFPHSDFPPWHAIGDVVELVADLAQRRQGPSFDKLMEPIADASEKIVEAASGGITPQRWHRRLTAAIGKCDQARALLAGYLGDGAVTEREALAIANGLDVVIQRLVDAWVDVKLPDEIKAELPILREHFGRALH